MHLLNIFSLPLRCFYAIQFHHLRSWFLKKQSIQGKVDHRKDEAEISRVRPLPDEGLPLEPLVSLSSNGVLPKQFD